MEQYIPKSALVAKIERRIEHNTEWKDACKTLAVLAANQAIEEDKKILSIINSLEVKEVNLEFITGWFDHIAQIADDRMTLTNQRMTDAHALDEIKCLAKNSSEFITKHYKAQKGE
ncbi:hypothetical protein [Prevotella sp. E2-28]|uniref:hypothetical protein n=1 Tax=Prevotella sp. E2-28 TaxID=2913620 RepID=UPI001EDA5D02|nr:hypothetical protein [Prevotella sp. E2-28]UKK52641.1 hypothetical protein L6465_08485 [Prevotella sp. E2-28]